MLYLVKIDRSTRWVDLPAQMVLEAAQRGELDLDRIPWGPAERTADDVTVRLALRHGLASSHGIVVRAVDISGTDRAEQLAESLAGVHRSQEALVGHDQAMEQLMPGWIESGRQNAAEVDAGVAESIAEAEKRLAERLTREPDAGLVAHWASLGGVVPDPV